MKRKVNKGGSFVDQSRDNGVKVEEQKDEESEVKVQNKTLGMHVWKRETKF